MGTVCPGGPINCGPIVGNQMFGDHKYAFGTTWIDYLFHIDVWKKNVPLKRTSTHFDYHHDVRPRTGICTHKIQAIVFSSSARTIQHLLYHIQTALVYSLVCQDLFEVALAKVFYKVNYVKVNYSDKNSTVDCKYLLFYKMFSLDWKQNSVQNANFAYCL